MEPLYVTEWGDGEPVVLVHGTRSWGVRSFAAQEPLAAHGYRLRVIDRRGFGRSPDTPQADFEEDARDVAELLADGAHLVGHSYGGVAALLAAAARPDAVRSLALIEPAVLALVADEPVVASFVAEAEAFVAHGPWPTAEDYLAAEAQAFGEPLDPAPLTPDERRAITTAMGERHVWHAEIPRDRIAQPPFPSLVLTGSAEADAQKRETMRQALLAAADAVAELLEAERLTVPGAGHSPHSERPEIVNDALLRLWRQPRP